MVNLLLLMPPQCGVREILTTMAERRIVPHFSSASITNMDFVVSMALVSTRTKRFAKSLSEENRYLPLEQSVNQLNQ